MSVVSGYLVAAVGYRWMLVIEGLPAIGWAFLFRHLVDDRPGDAAWLGDDERHDLEQSLAREQRELPEPREFRDVARSRNVLVLSAQVGQRPGEQPRYMHLGDAQALADLGLGEIPVKPQDQHPLLAFRQLVQVGVDGFDVDGMLDRRVVLAEPVKEMGRAIPGRQRSIERGDTEHQVVLARIADVVLGDPQDGGQFAVAGSAAEFLRQLASRAAHLEH